MEKKLKNKFTLLVLTLLLFSCGTTNRSYVYSDLDIKVKTALEAKVDVDMSNKLMGSSSGTYLFGLIKIFGDSKFADGYGGWGRLGKLKSAATYKAIKRGKGDILVSPQYEIKKSRYLFIFTVYNVKVRGYDGRITSIN